MLHFELTVSVIPRAKPFFLPLVFATFKKNSKFSFVLYSNFN